MILQRRIPFIDIISVSTNEVSLKNNITLLLTAIMKPRKYNINSTRILQIFALSSE